MKFAIVVLWTVLALAWSNPAAGAVRFQCFNGFTARDAVLVANHEGSIQHAIHATTSLIPASTLKIFTALTAIRYLGLSHRFTTEFYLDPNKNLKVKGYGDPLLISEVWQDIAESLSLRIRDFNNLLLDHTYFAPDIRIPGKGHSTNPYDAPVGALCANFNTIHYRRSETGEVVSGESQTPMTPIAEDKAKSLGPSEGRYTFTHDGQDAARYAGELLLHFLTEKQVICKGVIRLGRVAPGDTLLYTYRSPFTLDQCIAKMMEFSSNFMANQIFIYLGAQCCGPPGTLAKGIHALTRYATNELELQNIRILEGSGISRDNRFSARDMMIVLRAFAPYRQLLQREGNILWKTGTLRGIRTRAGYVETGPDGPYYFVIFLNGKLQNMDSLVRCISRTVLGSGK